MTTRFVRLSKRQARHRFSLGQPMYLCRRQDVPAFPFNQAALMSPKDYATFEKMMEHWKWANSVRTDPWYWVEEGQ